MEGVTEILVLAGEDFTGLWEALLSMRDDPEPQAAAAAALHQLLERGLVELYESEDPSVSDPTLVDLESAYAALVPGPQWEVPGQGTVGPLIYFAATAQGVDWLTEHHWGASG